MNISKNNPFLKSKAYCLLFLIFKKILKEIYEDIMFNIYIKQKKKYLNRLFWKKHILWLGSP